MIPTALSILHLEDDRFDAELVQRALKSGNLVFEISLVTCLADFIAAISADTYDLILSDYKLSDGDGLQAFKVAQQKAPDTPFVLVSGALGEELAIETIKQGVDDYVLKSNLPRLVVTVPNVVATAREKWEKKLALEELRLSEERFNLAVKGSGSGLWDWPNPAAEEMWWSPRTFELFGLENQQFAATRQNFLAQIYPEDLPAYQQALQAHLQLHQNFDVEFRVIHPDNSLHWLRTGGKAIWDKHGNPARMAGYLKDVSDYKQAEEERRKLDEKLRQSQKMEALGTLASGIAHDFNNMLASIVGYSALLALRLPKPSQEYQDLQEIQKAAERAKQLVRQILTFSRNSEQKKVPVQLDQVIDETLKMLRTSIPATIKIIPKISTAGECVLGDISQFHQVLMNLCVNAYHAMPKGGTLDLMLNKIYLQDAEIFGLPAGDYLKLEVADTGSGIAPEHLDKIFDPYFTTKDIDTGTGLGLSIVSGIIKDLKGDIRVKSSPKGTTFTLYLPCHQENDCKVSEN